MEVNEQIVVEESSNVEELPTVETSEEIIQMQDSLTDLQEGLTGLQELQTQVIELQSEVTGMDQFIIENSELVINTLNLINWFGYVGVPLVVIVMFFWTVYKQFLYTNL